MNQSTPTKTQRTEQIDQVRMLKRQKILDRMKQSQFSSLKGSSTLMDKLQKQRSAMKTRQDNLNMFNIIKKQQALVTELNSENLELIQQNTELKEHLNTYDKKYNQLIDQKNDLNTQNVSLKYQLLISQNNCAQSLKELQSARLCIKSLSKKNLAN